MLGSLRSRHWKPRGKEALDGAVATSSPSRRWMAVPPGPDVMRHLAVASRDATTSGLAFEPTSDRPVPESERERRNLDRNPNESNQGSNKSNHTERTKSSGERIKLCFTFILLLPEKLLAVVRGMGFLHLSDSVPGHFSPERWRKKGRPIPLWGWGCAEREGAVTQQGSVVSGKEQTKALRSVRSSSEFPLVVPRAAQGFLRARIGQSSSFLETLDNRGSRSSIEQILLVSYEKWHAMSSSVQENSFCGHYPVVVDLLQCLVADGALEDHTLKRVGFVAGHQLHTHHLTFSDGHITENLPEHEALIKHRRTRASANQLAVYGEKGLKATSDPVLPGISFCGYGCLQPPSAYRRRRCSRYVNRNRCNIISAVTASQDSSLCQQAPSLRHRRSRYVNRNCCIVTGTVSASTGVVVASHEPSLRHRCVCVPLQLARFQQAVPLVRYGLQHVLQGPDRFGGILALTRESCHDARGCHPTIPPLITGRCSSRAEYNKRAALPSAAKRRAPGTPHAQP
ncbi:hypothetical protein DNTS_006118, partial [Danionella cerebrum]